MSYHRARELHQLRDHRMAARAVQSVKIASMTRCCARMREEAVVLLCHERIYCAALWCWFGRAEVRWSSGGGGGMGRQLYIPCDTTTRVQPVQVQLPCTHPFCRACIHEWSCKQRGGAS